MSLPFDLEEHERILRIVQLYVAQILNKHDPALCEEIVQQACVIYLQRRPAELQSPIQWFLGICKNLLRRQRGDRLSRMADYDDTQLVDDDSAEPLAELVSLETRAAVRDCVAALSERDQNLLAWHHVDETKLAELSRRLGRPVGTIKADLFRARQAVRDCLQRKWR